MCSRYRVAPDVPEIADILDRIEDRVKTGDIYPTNPAPILLEETLTPTAMTWGFPRWGNQKGVVFNARAETVFEKRMFAKSARERRCVIPSTGFYEWHTDEDGEKTKYFFRRKSGLIVWIAGIWNTFENTPAFTMLTTQANEKMSSIHNRMPIIIDKDECKGWIAGSLVEQILGRTPIDLEATKAE